MQDKKLLFTVRNRGNGAAPANGLMPTASRGELLSNTLIDFRTEREFVEEVSKLWSEAQDRFLTIGRYLCRARAMFSGEFERTVIPMLPFGKSIAHQLRCVAEAVDRGSLLEEELPRSYSAAYRLTTLEPPHLERAKQMGLVQPTVTRSKIEAFIKDIRERRAGTGERRAMLQMRREKLLSQIRKLNEELAAVEREIDPAAAKGGDARAAAR